MDDNLDNIIENINKLDKLNDLITILCTVQSKINKLEAIDVASKLKKSNCINCLCVKQLKIVNTIDSISYDTSLSYKHASSKLKFFINTIQIECVYDQGDISLKIGDIKIIEYDSYSALHQLHNSQIYLEIEKYAMKIDLSFKEYIEMIACVIDSVITGKYKIKK
jgi:hypothetical protein